MQKVNIDINSGGFYADFRFVDAGFSMLLKSYEQKTLTKGVKTKTPKICTVFLTKTFWSIFYVGTNPY
jgi:hypothetical protein